MARPATSMVIRVPETVSSRCWIAPHPVIESPLIRRMRSPGRSAASGRAPSGSAVLSTPPTVTVRSTGAPYAPASAT